MNKIDAAPSVALKSISEEPLEILRRDIQASEFALKTLTDKHADLTRKKALTDAEVREVREQQALCKLENQYLKDMVKLLASSAWLQAQEAAELYRRGQDPEEAEATWIPDAMAYVQRVTEAMQHAEEIATRPYLRPQLVEVSK